MEKIHKSQVSATIIADSIGSNGIRLTTFQVRVPKFLLQEIARHRVLSLSFNSSRAIPAKMMRERVNTDPCEPLFWGSNRPGMSAESELTGWRLKLAKIIWRSHTKITLLAHYLLEKIGLHKQHVNRKLEADLWVDGVISATDWDNLFELRIHFDAQPEFRELAAILRGLLSFNTPSVLPLSAWHLPYISDYERQIYTSEILRDLSASRCARVSYGLPDFDYQKDIIRARKLKTSNPPHYSPFEHIAQSMYLSNYRSGNYRGWHQYRKTIEDGEI